jgi:hypothetical protein
MALALLLWGCLQALAAAESRDAKSIPRKEPAPSHKLVRESAVAGLFYPKEAAALSRMIEEMLGAVEPEAIAEVKGLVCPHAGYVYSGPVAAQAYRLLSGRDIRTVVVLAPSHYAAFRGASVCGATVYRTALGTVEISEKAKELARVSPFSLESRCWVQRPAWSEQSSRSAPAEGEDTPHTWEHADEVQVPFLQKVLKDFKLLPVIFGEVDAEKAARALGELLDDKTLVVASSDLSHYHPYAEAKALDSRCVKAICALDAEQMQSQEACGKTPILTLMHLAKQKGWKARLLDYRNSGDTAGDRSRVVGYAAIAFYAPGKQNYTAEERKLLLELARKTLREVVLNGRLPEMTDEGVPARLREPKGCFVTLMKNRALRGCIGHILPQEALHKAVMDNARSAAVRDPRFPAVQADELDKIEIEISVLTEPQPLSFKSPEDLLNKLQPYQDGVVLRIGDLGATYLPQVWAQIPDKAAFLSHLAQKAGCEPSAWRRPEATIATYRVESFKEGEP